MAKVSKTREIRIEYYKLKKFILICKLQGIKRSKTRTTKSTSWTLNDDIRLLELYIKRKTDDQMSIDLNRTPRAIEKRIEFFDDLIEFINPYKKVKAYFECPYSDDCLKCHLPACVEDGYDPNRDITNPKHRFEKDEWKRKDIDTVKRLKTIYSAEILANILNRPIEEVKEKMKVIV